VIRLETNNGLVACRLAGKGLGITIADPFIAWSSGSEGVVIRPFRPAITLRYAFLYPV
jgi:DNA-binding transcriptional LysR family regulator